MAYGKINYGHFGYGEDGELIPDIEPLTPDLMKYLPWYYQENSTMIEIQGALGKEVGMLIYHMDDLDKQFFIDTATWGLEMYEKELGLQTNRGLSYENRREIIKAKLRGRGTTTIQMIKNTAEAFSGGEVDVIEYPSEYRFVVKFIGVKGIPRNMQGFIDALESIKPAHLGYEFKYTYTVWNNLDNLTWNQAGMKMWDELKVYEGE